ncbi:MAG: cation transporter [Bryobacterales bacterium]|nr:cation transporter [Bryobacterales bacterium]
MTLSVAVGVLMLIGKLSAYFLTGSAGILSDAAESVIHVAAVIFAALSLYLSALPPTERSPYGYERMTFFSAGFEGGMIIVAAFWIIQAAIEKWRSGIELEQLGLGTLLVLAASLINLALGWYLIRCGRRANSLILIANGKHVLTDSWTSFGVVVGLILVIFTGWKPFDPLIAIAVALNIIWSGATLIRTAVRGLLDLPDPEALAKVRAAVERVCAAQDLEYHELRFRDTGQRLIVSVHLLFPYQEMLGNAHARATEFEARLTAELNQRAEVITHLEALEDHADLHPREITGR